MDDLIQKALQNFYSGHKGLEPHLFEITNEVMNQAIDKSVTLKYNVTNAAFIHELKYSASVFSAFKNHHQGKAIAALLYDADGKIVPESKFIKDALAVTGKYNKTWLRTERNTALRRGRMATKFKKFADDSHLYPNLRWLESTAGTPRIDHARYYNMVLPVNHSFWVHQFPGMDWNCKCDIEQTKDDSTEPPEELSEAPPGLEGNPAFTGEIIGGEHPFYKGIGKEEKKQLRKDFELLKEKTPYPKDANFTFSNGSKIYIHPYAHPKDLTSNLLNADVIAKAIENQVIKIRPHLDIDGIKNAEYLINNSIADLKHQRGNNVASNVRKAVRQECEMIVFKLEDGYSYSESRFVNQITQELNKHPESNVKAFYVIDKENKVTKYKV